MPPPPAEPIMARARSARSRLLARKYTLQPRRASSLAAARPMPDVAPVTTATRPVVAGRNPSLNSGRSRERTEMPIREKLPTTLASSSASAARASGLIRLPRIHLRHSRAHPPRPPAHPSPSLAHPPHPPAPPPHPPAPP